MLYIRTICLATLTTMALAATAASSASAAIICSTSGTGTACKSGHGNVYSGAVIARNSGLITLNVTDASKQIINTVTFEDSLLEGSVTGTTGTGSITKLTLNKPNSSLCSGVTATSTASTANPWPVTVATDGETENTNGISTTSNVTFSFSCSFLGSPVTCKYSSAKTQTTVDGSDTAPRITVTNVALELESGPGVVCGVIADWSGTYNLTTPTSLFVE